MSGKRKADHLPEQKSPKRQETFENALQTKEVATSTEENQNGDKQQKVVIETTLQRRVLPHPVEAHHSVLPLSMQLMKPFWSENCINCAPMASNRAGSLHGVGPRHHPESTPSFIGIDGKIVGNEQLLCSPVWAEQRAVPEPLVTQDERRDNGNEKVLLSQPENMSELRNRRTKEVSGSHYRKTHLVSIAPSPKDHTLPILQEYYAATQLYGCRQVNPGVLTALRFSLPALRVSGSFHDSDMLALSEVLFRHCNGALKHIRRLDFTIAGRFGKLHGRKGFGSHGAFTLSRVLCISKHIEEVFLQKNRIGPYGAAAIFAAASKNPVLKNIGMRRCGVGEKGAFAFVEHIGSSKVCALKEVDLSVNSIGFKGSIKIDEILIQKEEQGAAIEVDLEGNLVIQESKCLCQLSLLFQVVTK